MARSVAVIDVLRFWVPDVCEAAICVTQMR